ncbi:hypothetical protein PTKIN_Ptkin13bG0011300 [Pterospermum kingtungense]
MELDAKRSQEDQDLLERSTKKTQVMGEEMDQELVDVVMETPLTDAEAGNKSGGEVGISTPRVSFKGKLIGVSDTGMDDQLLDDGSFISDDEDMAEKEDEDDYPTIPGSAHSLLKSWAVQAGDRRKDEQGHQVDVHGIKKDFMQDEDQVRDSRGGQYEFTALEIFESQQMGLEVRDHISDFNEAHKHKTKLDGKGKKV